MVKKAKIVLTFADLCDIICKLNDEADSTLNEYTSAEKDSEKKLKKVLTNMSRCDIILKHSDERHTRVSQTKEIEP